MFRALWNYRGFVLGSITREFQLRYMGSALGALWTIINPLAMILVYTLVFSRMMKARLVDSGNDPLAYTVFLCSGTFAWTYFSEVVTRSGTMFLEQANLLKKSAFPRICLPAIVMGTATVNFVIIFGLFLGMLALIGRFPGATVLGVVPLLVIQQVFALGLGLIVGTLNVFFRDVGHITSIALQFWFWLTPVIYPISILPQRLRELASALNPMVRLVSGYQDAVLRGKWPDFTGCAVQAVLALVVACLGLTVYRRLSASVVDEL